ncbi:MAG: hypothetical protein V4577_26515 [Bacteroidota bacterium]
MAIFELYSKRKNRIEGAPLDILTYDGLPDPLRVQIVHIVRDAIDSGTFDISSSVYYKEARDILCKEYGLFELNNSHTVENEICNFLLYEKNVDRVLDAIELLIRIIDIWLRKNIREFESNRKCSPDEAIADLNTRFKEHAIGYAYESGKLIKIDSTYVHAEIVQPTLLLLSNPTFANANQEYLSAHEHYRHGKNKECLTDCLKAFESTMKIICHTKGWSVPPTATASALITAILTNGLIPSFLQSQMTALRSALESGVPTLRNKIGGHGQGAVAVTADDFTARYVLNLTGSNIIYLVELSCL